jgi:hypothetical protein
MPKDDDLNPHSSLFTKTLEFAGVFESGEHKSPQLSIEITYSQINAHPPTGIIRGTSAEYEALYRFFRTKPSPVCTLRSTSPERAITCHAVMIKQISEKMFAKDEQAAIHQVLGRFTIGRLEMRHHLKSSTDPVKRHMTFYLTGPSKLWMTTTLRTLAWSGNTTTDAHDDLLTLDSAAPDTVSVRPHFVYAESPLSGASQKHTVEAEIYALSVESVPLADEEEASFSERATALVDSLCLLMGFLSKARITWFESMLSGGGTLVNLFRDEKNVDIEAPHWEDVVLYADDIRPFLNGAIAAYRSGNIEVRLPILHYISAQSKQFVDDRFTVLFFALEKMLSALDERNREPLLLSKDQLSKLWETVRAELAKMQKTSDQIDLIEQKRGELQRPPLKHRINRHLTDLGIDISDIGGEEALGRMYRVRNHLTHVHGEPPIGEIMVETRRLETLVERMLLKLLNWQGKTHTPTSGNRPIEEDERKGTRS